jgi:hypothetical protein
MKRPLVTAAALAPAAITIVGCASESDDEDDDEQQQIDETEVEDGED